MNIRPFQAGLLGGFGLLALIALFLLNNYSGKADQEKLIYGSSVVIWGTERREHFEDILSEFEKQNQGLEIVTYVQKDARTFDADLVNALAEGNSPDLILMPVTSVVKHRSKLMPIPYETLPVRDFKNAYIDAADILMMSDGTYGLPLVMDPLILYWNRDVYSSNGISQPPATWESLVVNVVPTLTKRDSRRTILQSAVAFGEFQNITNAKPVLLTLMMQSGSSLITESSGSYIVGLNIGTGDESRTPLNASLQFFTDFSNSNSPLYSWNRAQPEDQNAFVSGDLATYFGFSSEIKRIAEKNPNLNFDVAVMPQGSGVTVRRTYAEVSAFVIPRAAKNKIGALGVAQYLTSAAPAQRFATLLDRTPVHRSLLARTDLNQFERVSYESALFARTWLDPDPSRSDDIFSIMVEDVVSSKARSAEAADDAVGRLKLIY